MWGFNSGRVDWFIFSIEVGSSLGLSGVCLYRKVDGSSVELDRLDVGLPVLVSDVVSMAAVSVRAYVLRSGVKLSWVVVDS